MKRVICLLLLACLLVSCFASCGTKAKLTIYPNATHDSWTETFRNPAVFDWLLEHTNAG